MSEQEIIKIMGEAYGEYVRAYDSLEDIDGARPPRDKYPDVVSYMVSKIWPTIKVQAKRIEELEAENKELKESISQCHQAYHKTSVYHRKQIKEIEKEKKSQVDDEDGHHFGYLLGPCRD